MIEAILAGLFGMLIGSFLNVCIYRLPRDLSVVHPRSHCTACEKTIAWYDNIPVVSYILLGGKCRYCKASYSITYPLVELVTGILFFISVYLHGANLVGYKWCAFSAIMVDLVVTDLFERILPDEFTLGGFVLGVALAAFTPAPSNLSMLLVPYQWPAWAHGVAEALIGGLFTAGLLWFTGWAYEKVRKREGLGLGDVKMMLVIGAFLGLPGTLITLFLGSVLGGVIGGLYILLSKADTTYELPFGSFLGLAAVIIGIGGERLMAWYQHLLGSIAGGV